MSEYDGLLAEGFRAKVKSVEEQIERKPVEQREKLRVELLKGLTRDQAIVWGRTLGEAEATSRRETGDYRESRVRRAMMYAAWEFDGKPMGRGKQYREEFGVADISIGGFLDREDVWRKRGEQA